MSEGFVAAGFEFEGVAGAGVAAQRFVGGWEGREPGARAVVVDDRIVVREHQEDRSGEPPRILRDEAVEILPGEEQAARRDVQCERVATDEVLPGRDLCEERGVIQRDADRFPRDAEKPGEVEADSLIPAGGEFREEARVEQGQPLEQPRPGGAGGGGDLRSPTDRQQKQRGRWGLRVCRLAQDLFTKLEEVKDQPVGVGDMAPVAGVHSRSAAVEEPDLITGGGEGPGRVDVPSRVALDAMQGDHNGSTRNDGGVPPKEMDVTIGTDESTDVHCGQVVPWGHDVHGVQEEMVRTSCRGDDTSDDLPRRLSYRERFGRDRSTMMAGCNDSGSWRLTGRGPRNAVHSGADDVERGTVVVATLRRGLQPEAGHSRSEGNM